MPPVPPLVDWLVGALRVAGDEALRMRAAGLQIQRKPDATLVTDADLAAERHLLAAIHARFPDDAVRSEEQGGTLDDARPGWFVDPIDGTSAFTEGLAHWGPTVARVEPGRGVTLGGLLLPRTGEWFAVHEGVGWSDGVPLRSIAEGGAPAVVYVPSRFHRHFRLDWRGKARCLGGTAAHLALVARGAAQAVIVAPGWAPWDTAAGLALIAAVGGVALRLPDGAPVDLRNDEGSPFVAGAPGTTRDLALNGRLTPHPSPP